MGRSIFALGGGEWDAPQLKSLLTATAAGYAKIAAYEMDLRAAGRDVRHLVLNAHTLDYAGDDQIRIVLTVADVTDARITEKLKDDLLLEKAVLLQEVQHRVANSLQIIASVLMQSARSVQSEETRRHLQDAHSRVMSIATVQQQLSTSMAGDVRLRPYFTQLCHSLGASMIHDHKTLSIEVNADESLVRAEVSVSLGLIVTELVINALKHAFPAGRKGKIMVAYQAHDGDWTLSVADDGFGMPPHDAAAAKPGLGTSIVQALARHLDASVEVLDNAPGANICIVHTGGQPPRRQPEPTAV